MLVAATTPFTAAADAAVAAPLAVALVSLVIALGGGRRVAPPRPVPPAMASGSLRPGAIPGNTVAPLRTSMPWLVLVVLVAGWEVFCFVALPRSSHPTLSSMYDAVSRWRVVKAVLVLAWMALGGVLVRR